MRFSTKIILLVSGLVVASGAVQSFLYGTFSTRLFQAQILQRMEDRALHAIDNLDRYFYERYNEAGALASEPLFAAAKAPPGQIAELLLGHLSWRREYVSAAYYDKDRALIADTGPERVWEQADLEPVWDEVASGRDFVVVVSPPRASSEPLLLLAFCVRDGRGAVRGLIVSRLPPGILSGLVGGGSGFVKSKGSVHMDLIDGKGLTLYSNYNPSAVLQDIAADWRFIEPRIQAGQTFGHLRYNNPAGTTGEELLFFVRERGFREFPGNDWTLSLWVPTAVAFAPATALRNRMALVMLLAGCVLLVCVFLLVRSFTQPIAELNLIAEQIGKGNLAARVGVRAANELGQFAHTFNRMAADLEESRTELTAVNRELEGLVEERTAELMHTNILLHDELSERVKAQEELTVKERLLRLNADIGEALTRAGPLETTLQASADIIVRSLDAAFVRFWKLGAEPGVLELAASAGEHTRLNGQHHRKVFGEQKIGIIAQTQRPVVTNAVIGDPAITDQEWARSERMTAFAGHPLVVDGKTLGVMALFSRRPLDSFVLTALETVADKIAAFIGRKMAEESLRVSEKRYRELFDSASDGIYRTDARGVIVIMNRAGAQIFGYEKPEEIIGQPALEFWRDPEDRANFLKELERAKSVGLFRIRARKKSGELLELETSSRILEREDGAFLGIEGVLRDVTSRVRAEEERELLIAELQEAVANIRTLSGLLPICAGCKKIRDEQGRWNQIETYVSAHTAAEFSHGLCPDCRKAYFPGIGGG